MAEGNDINTPENCVSVEIDAAPSVDYVNLDVLDIGSECEIKTESKQGEIKLEDSDAASTQENHGEKLKTSQICDEPYSEGNIETCLGSLNLVEKVEPEVGDPDREYMDGLTYLDSDGDTLLHIAVLLRHAKLALEIINLMVGSGVTLDIGNNLHQTPLHLAVLTEQMIVVNDLLSAGASVFQRDHKLRTPLMIACTNDSMEMLDSLLNPSILSYVDNEATSMLLNPDTNPLDLPNADGERCLHIAAKHNRLDIVQKLIDNGANPNLPDRKSGRTPLHVASDLGYTDMVEYLMSREEVDINEVTYNNETALELAHMRGRTEVVRLLRYNSLPITKRKSKTDSPTGKEIGEVFPD